MLKPSDAKKIFMPVTVITILVFYSCKKFAEIPLPAGQLTSNFVFTNDNAAIESVTGIYSQMMNNSLQFSDGNTTFFPGMSADELYYYTPGFRDEFVNDHISLANHGYIEANFWNPCYKYIYAANKAMEGAAGSETLSAGVKQMVIGEAKFIRAFCYFHLINLFGDIPLVLSSDYQSNQSLPRTPVTNIYEQIINDLKDAQNDLLSVYPSVERARPNKWAAASLLARIYLYAGKYDSAEVRAGAVIDSGSYSLVSNLNTVFLINSNETIWQLKPVNPSRNTWEGYWIIPASNSSAPAYLLTSSLVNAFEINDQRKINWAKSKVFGGQTLYYPYKYKVRSGSTLTEYYVVLRLAEQYLIRAEARAQQNNISGAQADLNMIRNRAGLVNTAATDRTSLLLAIEHERQTELFAEWGHRWFDLKRTSRANTVLWALKPSSWQPTDALWPIPQNQIYLNPSLTQNPGY